MGTTLWQAIQQAGLSSSVKLNFVGTRTKGNYHGDVGIVEVGETPYAEGNGDTNTLALSSTDATEVSDVCSRVTKCIVLLFSGRPIIINQQLNQSSAFVVAWIGSTEGEGITETKTPPQKALGWRCAQRRTTILIFIWRMKCRSILEAYHETSHVVV